MLDLVPTDLLHHIFTFLNFKETMCVVKSHTIPAQLDQHIRHKRMKWIMRKLNNTLVVKKKIGVCADNHCTRQKSVCINILKVETLVLSHYCGKHTLKYKHIDSITFI